MVNRKTRKDGFAPARLSLSVALALAAMGSMPALAFNIDTGNPDAKLRWDTQVRYNAGWRMEGINPDFANSFGTDETETRFGRGDLIMNRLDVFTEMDYTIRDRYGFRVSASIWSENAYPGNVRTSDLVNATYTGANAVPSSYGTSGQYSDYARRYVTGTSGEFLDAFAFGTFDLGTTSLNVKLGKHNVYWGETMFSIADGVSAGQGPIDGIKGTTSPGAEAKELFMPVNQISANWNLNSEVSLMGQYMLDWKPTRITPGGTYFAAADGSGNPAGGGSPVCANTISAAAALAGFTGTCIAGLAPVMPDEKKGNFGLALRWSPSWLNGTAGFYYRKYDEKLPWSVTQLQGGLASARNYNMMGTRLSFARDTEMFGASLQKNLGPVSAAFELSYRKNTALQSIPGFFVGSQGYSGATLVAPPATFAPNYFLSTDANVPLGTTPDYTKVEGARGDTYHLVANAVWLLPKTALWEAGNLQAELSYQRLDKVTKNPNVFFSEQYACNFGYLPKAITAGLLNRNDGCATKDSLAMNIGFTPQWLQVMPGLDLSMPTSLSYGLRGNSPTLGGSNEGAYKWSIGLTAVYRTLYEFGVALVDQHTDYKATAGNFLTGVGNIYTASSTASSQNGSMAVQNNHRWLNFRFKTSF